MTTQIMTTPFIRDVLLIDNFDSFSYNLVEEFSCLGCQVTVLRNDVSVEYVLQRLAAMKDPLLVLSPGPGTPEQAGNCIALIKAAAGRYPMLGVCLGHQAMTVAFGGVVGRAPQPLHGERCTIQCEPHPLFRGLPKQLMVGRYHSLAATEVPADCQVIAEAFDAGAFRPVVMAMVHKRHAIAGLQFHPESILTTYGRDLLANAVQLLREPKTKENAA
ncbi:MAG TPA: aminodeoxychorismate/anthranilate synthase component II [Permianibacter sp.]|nr:aminodeoxychorismate/anthranilate synthase component II [Permianibacter sp.]